ncbi:MAG: hypothetical protein Tsb0020_36940 [Haliangiales bacterium]
MVVAALAVGSWACADDEARAPAVGDEAKRARRVLDPPAGEVLAVPPHAIHALGVGPYRLGISLREVLRLSSRGPRVTLIQVDGVVDYSLVRPEGDGLIVGVDGLNEVVFVSVLDREIARTESSLGVGSEVAALEAALGPVLSAPERAMDPRLLGFAALPNVRFLLDDERERVRAVVVRQVERRALAELTAAASGSAPLPAAPPPAAAEVEPDAAQRCPSAAQRAWAESMAHVLNAAGESVQLVRVACLLTPGRGAPTAAGTAGTGAGAAQALVTLADRVVVVAGTAERPRRVASYSAPGVIFAQPLDVGADGHDEVAIVRAESGADWRALVVELVRLEGSRLVRLGGREAYRLSERSAAWIGAQLAQLSWWIELEADDHEVHVSGLFVRGGGAGPAIVAPLSPVQFDVQRRRGSSASGADAGSPESAADAGAGAADGGGVEVERSAPKRAAPRSRPATTPPDAAAAPGSG